MKTRDIVLCIFADIFYIFITFVLFIPWSITQNSNDVIAWHYLYSFLLVLMIMSGIISPFYFYGKERTRFKIKINRVLLVINVIVVFVPYIYITYCYYFGKDSDAEYYLERMYAYEEVADYLQSKESADFKSLVVDGNGDTRLFVNLYDIEVQDESLMRSIKAVEDDFDAAWLENDSVIFWEDERKRNGLLYSDHIFREINILKEWYKEIEWGRITRKWYRIGYWGL